MGPSAKLLKRVWSMKYYPPISICIPVYNGEDYVGEAIQSVLDQDYPNFEVNVCENVSTDGTLNVIQRFEDPRLKVQVADTHVHLAANLNRAAQMATQPWVLVLSADDMLLPGALDTLARNLGKYPDADLLIGRASYIVEEENRVLGRSDYIHEEGVVPDLENFVVGNSFPVNINAVLLKKELAVFREDCGVVCDLNLMIKLGQEERRAVLVDNEIIGYREHAAATSSNRVKMWTESLAVYLDYIDQSNKPEFYRRRISRMLFWCGAFLASENRKEDAKALIDQASGAIGGLRTKALKLSLAFPVALSLLERARGLRRRFIGNSS